MRGTVDEYKALVMAHFHRVTDVMFHEDVDDPGVVMVEIRGVIPTDAGEYRHGDEIVAAWLQEHPHRIAGIQFIGARKLMLEYTVPRGTGRFAKSDADYAVNLKLRNTTDRAGALEELRRTAEAGTAKCQHTAQGWACELPVTHQGPHQMLTRSRKRRVIEAVMWDDNGAPVAKRCQGPEASFACQGLIYSRRQSSAYEDDGSNFTVPVCPRCFKDIEERWAEQWADYHAGLL